MNDIKRNTGGVTSKSTLDQFRPIMKIYRSANWAPIKIISLVLLLPIFLSLLGFLWLIEDMAVSGQQSLEEGEGSFVSMPAEEVDKANEGKLLHVTGMAKSNETLVDPRFKTVSASNSLRLERRVQMYQWSETRRKKRVPDGSNADGMTEYKTVVYYTHKEIWSSKLIDSSTFHRSGRELENPKSMPVEGLVIYADAPRLGAYGVTESLIDKMGNEQTIVPKDTVGLEGARILDTNGEGFALARVMDGTLEPGLYHGSSPFYGIKASAPAKIGDLRISFHAQMPHEATIIAQQTGDTLTAFTASNGETLELVENGRVKAEKMFGNARVFQSSMTWFFRCLIGLFLFIIVFIKFWLFPELIEVIPLLGDLKRCGAVLFSLVVTFCATSAVAGATWVSYRPFSVLPFLLWTITMVVLPRFINKQSPPEMLAESPPPASHP